MPNFSAYDRTPLAYHLVGEGEPLICLPGGPMRAIACLGDLGGLAARRRLVLLDLRGTGASGVPEDPSTYRRDRLVDDVEALREHLGLERIDVLTHSAGADPALLHSARHPERLRSLTLVTPSTRAVGIEATDQDLREAAEPLAVEAVKASVYGGAELTESEAPAAELKCGRCVFARRGPRRRPRPPDRPHPRLREAVRVQRHGGALPARLLPAAAAGRCGRLLRPARPRVHAPNGSARHGGLARRVQGPPQRTEEPLRSHPRPRLTLEKVQSSPMLWDPVRYSETWPSSDGACAMIPTDRAGAGRSPHPPAWVHGGAMRSEPTLFAGKDFVSPQAGKDCAADVHRQARITDPRREIDAVEMYVPFSCCEPMWLENLGFADEGEGWKLTEAGVTELDGDLPVNPSGGVLSTNPMGASGMIRFAEAALQVRGEPGSTRSTGAARALGHAYGGGSQFFAMWLVGAQPPPG
ncbi:alpha/beta fold hydrolase [Streptomyces globisporus]|uniref:alpha/beta fold hydrolase n=1 Tax=Streptomyces globisporus TaxID=1908 RepID=UPI0033F6B23B